MHRHLSRPLAPVIQWAFILILGAWAWVDPRLARLLRWSGTGRSVNDGPRPGQCARYVPERVSPGGDSRSLVASRAKLPQISVLARRPRGADETSQADSPVSIRSRSVRVMDLVRQVIVFDAAEIHAESAFWAGILGGRVFKDDDWHSVIDAAGEWRIGVQLAPNHVPPDWPHGTPQQVHLDLHVNDPRAAHEEAIALGARLLQPAPDFDAAEGHQVYADPAGHPFCIGWGHPSREAPAEWIAAH